MKSSVTRDNRLRSNDRLKLRKDIETLFLVGKAFSIYPYRVVYRIIQEPSSDSKIKIGVAIPKRKINKSVSRNLIKRRTREAWRLQKSLLLKMMPEGKALHCFLIYTEHKQLLPYHTISEAITAINNRLSAILQNDNAL